MKSSKVIRSRNASEPQRAEPVRMSIMVTKKVLTSLKAAASRQAKSEHLRDLERGKQFTPRRFMAT